VPADTATPRGSPLGEGARLLETDAEVEELAVHLAGEPLIALDTEADSFHSYFTKVCLIQISTRTTDVIIDPLAVGSLAPLGPVFADPRIAVVLHGADYDVRILDRDHALHVRGLFDTMIAARFLGNKAFGLSNLVEQYFEVRLPKEHQRADWSRRPLSAALLRYAANDTHHLPALHDRLREDLAARGRLTWAEEEFGLLEQVRHQVREDDREPFLRIKGAKDLDRRGLAVLRAAAELRDAMARELDRAPFRVLGNETLIEIAKQRPRRPRDLASLRGLPRGRKRSFDTELLGAVTAALDVPEADLPQFPRRTSRGRPEPEPNLTPLKKARDLIAAQLDLEPAFLAPNALLEAAARQRPADEKAFLTLPGARRWQAALLSAPLSSVLAASGGKG